MIEREKFNNILRTNLLGIVFLGIFCLAGCQKKENNCSNSEVAFDLEIDLSAVLDHESTDQTTHIKIYFEDYYDTGDLESYEQFEIAKSNVFKESICLPISQFPIDSIIVALKLIQNNVEEVKDPTIYLNVPFSKSEVNCIVKEINSTYLWDKPACLSMPTVFQNLDDIIEGEEHSFNISVAGGYGIGLNAGNGEIDLEYIKLIGDMHLLDYYEGGLCPCSKYYVEFK